MTDSEIPRTGKGGNLNLIVIGAGIALIIAAGVALFLRMAKPAAPPVAPVTPAALFTPPAPLVIEEKIAFIPLGDTDTTPSTDSGPPAAAPKKPANEAGPMGTIDPVAVSQFMRAHFDEVRTCYERRLKVNPSLGGIVDLRFFVAQSGKVSKVTVNSDTVGDSQMLACVRATASRWTLPAPQGGRAVFDKPFEFKKKS